MGRNALIRTDHYPYHLWARVNNKERWPLPLETAWEEFRSIHNLVVARFNFQSLAFVMMNNHYHWLLVTPDSNLDLGMRYFQTTSSKRLLYLSGRMNRLYGGRYGWSVIRTQEKLLRNYRYILMNPVRAGATSSPDQYTFSTMNSPAWDMDSANPLLDGVPAKLVDRSKWMLDLRETDDEDNIRIGLRRRVFKMPRGLNGYRDE